VLKYLHAKGLIDGTTLTCTGERVGAVLGVGGRDRCGPRCIIHALGYLSLVACMLTRCNLITTCVYLLLLSSAVFTQTQPHPQPHPDHIKQIITGKTMAENLASVPELRAGQDVILPLDQPIKPEVGGGAGVGVGVGGWGRGGQGELGSGLGFGGTRG